MSRLTLKSFLIVTLILLCTSFTAAEEIVVPSGGDLRDAVATAQSGDVVVLVDGGVYDLSANEIGPDIAISGKQITIKAVDNAVTQPEVSFSGFNVDGEGNAVLIQGITFLSKGADGNRTSYFINFTEAFIDAIYLKVVDCEADGFRRCVIRADRVESVCDSLIFHNNIFVNLDESYRLFHFGARLDYVYFQLTNSTVANFTEAIVWSTSFSQKTILIDNCTFDGISVVSPNIFTLDGDPGSVFKLTDCLLTNFADGSVFSIPAEFIADTVQTSRFFSIGDTTNTWDYMADFSEADPGYADAANFDFTLPANSPLQTAGTNGSPIGDPRWSNTPTSVKDLPDALPAAFGLQQNYPNPFNPGTHITFTLGETGHVSLQILNTLGQEVARLVDGIKPAGSHQVTFDARGLSSGLYFYRLSAAGRTATKKMLLMK